MIISAGASSLGAFFVAYEAVEGAEIIPNRSLGRVGIL